MHCVGVPALPPPPGFPVSLCGSVFLCLLWPLDSKRKDIDLISNSRPTGGVGDVCAKVSICMLNNKNDLLLSLICVSLRLINLETRSRKQLFSRGKHSRSALLPKPCSFLRACQCCLKEWFIILENMLLARVGEMFSLKNLLLKYKQQLCIPAAAAPLLVALLIARVFWPIDLLY